VDFGQAFLAEALELQAKPLPSILKGVGLSKQFSLFIRQAMDLGPGRR
jgi:hypothetical protein